MRHAIVLNNQVVGVAEWDGQSEWVPPFGGIAIPLAEEHCEVGWIYNPQTRQFVTQTIEE